MTDLVKGNAQNFVKKFDGNNHVFGGFLADISQSVDSYYEYVLNSGIKVL